MKKLNKQDIERICRNGCMEPVKRGKIEGAELFIADGVSMPPHLAHRRFGIGPEQFPGGMHVTLWWLARGEDKLDVGSFLYFELFHDPMLSREGKRRARINAATQDARQFLAQRKRARAKVN